MSTTSFQSFKMKMFSFQFDFMNFKNRFSFWRFKKIGGIMLSTCCKRIATTQMMKS